MNGSANRVIRLLHLRTNQAHRQDPTRTLTLRRQWAEDASGRIREVRRAARRAIIDEDGFGLLKVRRTRLPKFFGVTRRTQIATFRRWLVAEIDTALDLKAGAPWVRARVEQVYLRGLAEANARLKATGLRVPLTRPTDLLRQPLHREAVEKLFRQALAELREVAKATEGQAWREAREVLRLEGASRKAIAEAERTGRISRATARALRKDGVSPTSMARAVDGRLDKIGRTRSRQWARVNTINTHGETLLNRFEQMGVKEVEGLAEFVTAQDDRVCSRCEGLEGETYTIDEARGIIPVHVGCRCSWVPKLTAAQLDRLDGGARGRLAA